MLTLERVDAGVTQRLVQRLVGVLQVDVLADESDVDLVLGMLVRVDDLLPLGQVGGAREDLQLVADDLVEHLLVQHHRDLVDRVDVPGRDHRLLLDVGEKRDLALSSSGSGWIVRHRTASAWMPISRSSFTECCVGLVLISPADWM